MSLPQVSYPSATHAKPKTSELFSPQAHVGMLYCPMYYFPQKTSEIFALCLLSCRRELSYFGVKVAIIEPGGFKTALSNSDKMLPTIKKLFDQANSEIHTTSTTMSQQQPADEALGHGVLVVALPLDTMDK
ncbi:hypothetical protein A6R68_13891, partial [Neotoma lepida]